MSFKYLFPNGEIDQQALARQVERDCQVTARNTGRHPTDQETCEALAYHRREAYRERAVFFGWTADHFHAAMCFVFGMLDGLTPPRAAYTVSAPVKDEHGYFDHLHVNAQIMRQRNADMLATLDHALIAAANRMDAGNRLLAAE
jgi:hypothetical protein